MSRQSSASVPPPAEGGGGKWIVILLVLIIGGTGVWFATRSDPKPVAAPVVPKSAERSTSLAAEDMIEIPLEEDAGVEPDAEVAPVAPKRKFAKRDPWACSGDMPPAAIRQVIQSSRSTIRKCYERRLRTRNMLQGSVNLQVKVGTTGSVVATRIRGSLKDSDVRSCVGAQAKTWKFPAPTGGCVVFAAPYNFTPKN